MLVWCHSKITTQPWPLIVAQFCPCVKCRYKLFCSPDILWGCDTSLPHLLNATGSVHQPKDCCYRPSAANPPCISRASCGSAPRIPSSGSRAVGGSRARRRERVGGGSGCLPGAQPPPSAETWRAEEQGQTRWHPAGTGRGPLGRAGRSSRSLCKARARFWALIGSWW